VTIFVVVFRHVARDQYITVFAWKHTVQVSSRQAPHNTATFHVEHVRMATVSGGAIVLLRKNIQPLGLCSYCSPVPACLQLIRIIPYQHNTPTLPDCSYFSSSYAAQPVANARPVRVQQRRNIAAGKTWSPVRTALLYEDASSRLSCCLSFVCLLSCIVILAIVAVGRIPSL
jgi:hypothetical protein